MKASAISTFSWADDLLTEFYRKHDIRVRLTRCSGKLVEHLAGGRPRAGDFTWRIAIDKRHSLAVVSQEFPDHLLGELVDLAYHMRRRLHAVGN